jgi:hypothetical protein
MLMNSKSINVNQPVKRNRSGGGRPFHSRLEPFTDFIREQRQQRQTWQEIATRLRIERGCVITSQGLHQFYRRYLKRQARSHWESQSATPQPATVNPSATTPTLQPATTKPKNPYQFNLGEI